MVMSSLFIDRSSRIETWGSMWLTREYRPSLGQTDLAAFFDSLRAH
jgi:hypothetical protein